MHLKLKTKHQTSLNEISGNVRVLGDEHSTCDSAGAGSRTNLEISNLHGEKDKGFLINEMRCLPMVNLQT